MMIRKYVYAAGLVLALLVMLVGLIVMFNGQPLGGLFLTIIGGFLWYMAAEIHAGG